MTEQPLSFLENDKENAVARLCDLLSIPSVSTDPAYEEHIQAGAQWTRQALIDVGLDAEIHATAGHPCVIANTNDEDVMNTDAPRVMFYGHYDVQPPDPLELWTTPAFEPTIRDGAIYARGASDDKGQVCCFIEALRSWKETHGKFPCRIVVLIEGEEEVGSPNLQPFIAENKDLFPADIVLVSDTHMWDRETVTITYGLRGLLYFDVQLHGPSRDLHSGIYGGILANPATLLTRIIGRLQDDQNRVTIPGFYDDVAELTEDERARWEALNFDEFGDCLTAVGVDTTWGEEGFTTLERKWARPSCDVNGIYGGYMGEGAKTVIPTFAGAKVSFRLPPRQDPRKIARAFEAWLRSFDVGGCRWKITNHGMADPVMVSDDSPFIAAAQRAIEQASGKAPNLVREGATIPVVADFKQALGLNSLLIGFGLTDDCIHSPNEKFELNNFELGCRTHAILLAELAKC